MLTMLRTKRWMGAVLSASLLAFAPATWADGDGGWHPAGDGKLYGNHGVHNGPHVYHGPPYHGPAYGYAPHGGYYPHYPYYPYHPYYPYYPHYAYYPAYPGYSYYHDHDHHDHDEVAYLVGGLLLGGVLTHVYDQSQHYAAPAPGAYPGGAASSGAYPSDNSRRLVRDQSGNCFESVYDSSGAEMRTPVSPTQCNW